MVKEMLLTEMQVTGLRAEGGCVADDSVGQVEYEASGEHPRAAV